MAANDVMREGDAVKTPPEIVKAIDLLTHFSEIIASCRADELERFPYLPYVQETIEELTVFQAMEAALSRPDGGEVAVYQHRRLDLDGKPLQPWQEGDKELIDVIRERAARGDYREEFRILYTRPAPPAVPDGWQIQDWGDCVRLVPPNPPPLGAAVYYVEGHGYGQSVAAKFLRAIKSPTPPAAAKGDL